MSQNKPSSNPSTSDARPAPERAGALPRPERRLSVVDSGAKGDGRTFCTEALQRAIDRVAADGGGTVVVPEGVFLSGALFLKPGVNLHLEKNAVLRGSTRIDDYPRMLTRIEGRFQEWRPALINAAGCDRLRITGEGAAQSGRESAIEGSGQPFWQEFWRRRIEDPNTKNLDVERPRLIYVADSTDVAISGVALRDSAHWHLHLYRCRDVRVEDVSVRTPVGAPSTDGIDIDSCQDVAVRRCHISVDDDCIALKGSKGPRALDDTDSPPVERILIEDCTFGLGHAAVTCGSEATVVRDVRVERCRVVGPTGPRRISLLRLKLRPDTPQTYEDIHFRDIALDGVGRIVLIAPWTQYFDLQGEPPPESTVRNVTLSNVSGSFETFGQIKGHDKARLADIRFENFDVRLQDGTLAAAGVENLVLDNVVVNGKQVEMS
ncbi:exopolygalacturonase [Candidatus Sumerlaeota bacterium]|nr:exopolygalacturonase [Candidatus Sumerlaeota bacterium]